ncbi:hypothetical protein SAMN04489740_4105 [Arthrobacter alpinus]|uniref:Alkylmercury lyase n=1 Tax=Arthrobacter alpinus TaxID=656366 RepID=A0A1H5PEE4_9MICC|nr:hypothetical protein [Arthrobacter alpinus]SEF11458.1 hypothetical protein SAMN04489740_4105 [Arthrobacter alpinus]
MNFELRLIAGCPHAVSAQELFTQALELEVSGPVTLSIREINTDEEAETFDFHGSPSFTVGGNDLFPTEADPGVTCRVYHTDQGLSGQPTLESLREAVRASLTSQSLRD